MATPKTLIEILDRVTEPQIAAPEALGATTRQHYERVRTIFEDENIVGAGIARKVTGSERTNELGIVFYVREKLPMADLRPDQILPPVMAAANGRAVYTDVVEIGEVVPQENVQNSPLQSGFSVGHKDIEAGTLGAVVRKGRKQFLLSNSHVLANSGLASLGDAILYPGFADGGADPTNVVAKLSAFSPFTVGNNSFTNTVDAALAEIDASQQVDVDSEIWTAATPLKVATPARDMVVKKRGRTTGDTQSIVRDVDFRVLVKYPGVGVVGFSGQVLCDTYTASGDSGALVVSDEGAVVGLHFSGSPKGSIFTPIRTVMDALKFKF
ncbi:hypothetical protein ACU8OQ_36995 (plasmid) [Rhizobium leguminosarum]